MPTSFRLLLECEGQGVKTISDPRNTGLEKVMAGSSKIRRLFKKAAFSPARPLADISPSRPESAKTASSPWDAALSQARPQRAKRRRRTLRYVEPLSDARTKLADFFSILLGFDLCLA